MLVSAVSRNKWAIFVLGDLRCPQVPILRACSRCPQLGWRQLYCTHKPSVPDCRCQPRPSQPGGGPGAPEPGAPGCPGARRPFTTTADGAVRARGELPGGTPGSQSTPPRPGPCLLSRTPTQPSPAAPAGEVGHPTVAQGSATFPACLSGGWEPSTLTLRKVQRASRP